MLQLGGALLGLPQGSTPHLLTIKLPLVTMVFDDQAKLDQWMDTLKVVEGSTAKLDIPFLNAQPQHCAIHSLPLTVQKLIFLKACMSLWGELEIAFCTRAARSGDLLVCLFVSIYCQL
jgi:hypothetical protein